MGSMRNWMLGAAVLAGTMGLGATTAQAAEFGLYVRGPVAYVPPCRTLATNVPPGFKTRQANS